MCLRKRCEFFSMITDHNLTSCPKQKGFQRMSDGRLFQEHNMNASAEIEALTDRIEKTMGVTNFFLTEPKGIFGKLDGKQYKRSFVINEVQAPSRDNGTQGSWSVRELIFNIFSIGKDGMLDAMATNIWVRGSVMNEMLSASGHGRKNPPKFAYDHTTSVGDTVSQAGTFSQLSQLSEPS